ncbi:MAG: hypothetical protein QMD36_03530 [Candidatus Aenigmarchaeota archaeon]|nr:hypothetical protein [Candidatus Aenigmarchaeota archaeon]
MRTVYMLTAVIMSIAGIFTLWGSNLIRQRLNTTENTSIEICASASFRFYSGRYDKNNMNLYLILENQRSIDLKLEKLYLFYPNAIETFELNKTLEGNILKSFNIPRVRDGFNSGTIKTNCPDVSADFGYSQVT